MKPTALTREVHAFLAIYKKVFGGDPKVIVECGARDFVETTLFSQLSPKSHIYSFECNPFTLPKCRERLAQLSNVELIEKAVSDKDGSTSFYPTDPEKTVTELAEGNPGASSLFKANPDWPFEKLVQNEITVETTRLDTVMSDKGIQTIGAIWMDIQGAELAALQGLGNQIRNVELIYLEVGFFPIYQGQPLFHDLKRFLNQHGFKLFGFINYSGFDGDAIFVNDKKIKGLMRYRLLLSDALAYPYVRRKIKYDLFLKRVRNRVRKAAGAPSDSFQK